MHPRFDKVWDNKLPAPEVAAIDPLLRRKLHDSQLVGREFVGIHVPRHQSKRYGLLAALGGEKALILGRAHE